MRKKIYTITLIVFLMLLLISIGAIKSTQAQGYERMDWPTVQDPVIDGVWTNETEWTDGEETVIDENAVFRSTWDYIFENSTFLVWDRFVVEILDDDTDDAGDYWEMCIDRNASGGSALTNNTFRIEVMGHTDLTVYQGDGTGWVEVTPEEGDLVFAALISESPTSSTPHWIIEFSLLKNSGVILMEEVWAFRLAVYDESNSDAGVRAWPPDSDPDVPGEWGVQNYSSDPIPEGLSFGVLVLLSSVAVIATAVVFRKRLGIDKSS